MRYQTLLLGSLVILTSCAAREKAPEPEATTNCCVVRVTNHLATALELDYTRFSNRQETDQFQHRTSQSGTFSLSNEKIAAGQQQKTHVSKGTTIRIKYLHPNSGQITQTEVKVEDFLDVHVTAEGIQSQATPQAERPLLAL